MAATIITVVAMILGVMIYEYLTRRLNTSCILSAKSVYSSSAPNATHMAALPFTKSYFMGIDSTDNIIIEDMTGWKNKINNIDSLVNDIIVEAQTRICNLGSNVKANSYCNRAGMMSQSCSLNINSLNINYLTLGVDKLLIHGSPNIKYEHVSGLNTEIQQILEEVKLGINYLLHDCIPNYENYEPPPAGLPASHSYHFPTDPHFKVLVTDENGQMSTYDMNGVILYLKSMESRVQYECQQFSKKLYNHPCNYNNAQSNSELFNIGMGTHHSISENEQNSKLMYCQPSENDFMPGTYIVDNTPKSFNYYDLQQAVQTARNLDFNDDEVTVGNVDNGIQVKANDLRKYENCNDKWGSPSCRNLNTGDNFRRHVFIDSPDMPGNNAKISFD